MKKYLPLLALAVLVTACAPWKIYYREGVSVGKLENDRTACEVKALRDAPVANQIRQNPPVYYPGRTVCDAGGRCVQLPGRWVPGGFYTVDVNAGLRQRVETLCMAGKGYEPVELPRCSPAVRQAAPVRATLRLPPLTSSACVIRYDDGTWQIVNPVLATKPN